jgi:hypothetical protein
MIGFIVYFAAAVTASPQPYPGWTSVGDNAYELFRYMGPLRKSRAPRIVGYGVRPISEADDSSCTAPYWTTEKVTSIDYAYDFVIHSFTTWNPKEGKQIYNVGEDDFSNFAHFAMGYLHDLVKEGATLKVRKQRCGQGSVASLVTILPGAGLVHAGHAPH